MTLSTTQNQPDDLLIPENLERELPSASDISSCFVKSGRSWTDPFHHPNRVCPKRSLERLLSPHYRR